MPDSDEEMESFDFFEPAEVEGKHDVPLASGTDADLEGEVTHNQPRDLLDPSRGAFLTGSNTAESGSTIGDEPTDTDIEDAYQKALAALEDAEWGIDDASEADLSPARANETQCETSPDVSREEALPGESQILHAPPSGDVTPPTVTHARGLQGSTAEARSSAPGPRLAPGTDPHPPVDPEEYSSVTPGQVIEAALFVGGVPLTPKKVCALLRNSFDVKFVEQTIDELNTQYAAEGRPYEIRLGDGGYRLELRPEHEKLRQRTYGSGPREVKLSQDVLEVLALVAYRQPISQAEIESHGKQNAGNLLRQLLRRDLVAIQRGEGGRKDVRYLTTPRFLTVFGIGSLDELPQPDDLARK